MMEECKRNAGCWSIDEALLLDQVLTTLHDSAQTGNSKEIPSSLPTFHSSEVPPLRHAAVTWKMLPRSA